MKYASFLSLILLTRISYLELPQRTSGSSCSIIQFAPGIVACDEGRGKVLLL